MIFKLHAETPIVQGYLRSCVYDLPRQAHDFLPNEVAAKLKAFENAGLAVINQELDEEDKKWLGYILEKEYGFIIDQQFRDCFPKIDFDWTHPALISNAIIDIDIKTAVVDFSYLEELNCKHILLRFPDVDKLEDITSYLKKALLELTFKSVDILVEKNDVFSKKEYTHFAKRLLKEVPQVTNVSYDEPKAGGMFVPHFVINIEVFAEAQQHNTFFNRKLYLAANGDVRNAIEHTQVYGNLNCLEQFEDLATIVDSKPFQEVWHTPKDVIDVCSDCEFRYMCIDNRLPRKRHDGSLYYEEECTYNPYIAKWFGDENYMSLDEAGIHVGEAGLELDEHRVAVTNERVWAE
jgi:hypothetical protein